MILLAGGVTLTAGCASDANTVGCRTVLNCKDDSVPICDASSLSCRSCKPNSDDTACRNRNTATPVCGPAGRCVACVKNSDCPGNRPSCIDNACIGCSTASDCASRVCNLDGSCAAPTDVIFVDNKGGACQGSAHSGSTDDPYCTIQDAVNVAASTGKSFVAVAPTGRAYDAFTITMVGAAGLRLSNSNPTMGNVQIRASSTDAVSISLTSGAKVVLSGFDIAAGPGNGIICSGSVDLIVSASLIHHSANGFVSNGCTVNLDGLKIYKNDVNGVSLTSNTNYTLNNLMIWRNDASGITLSTSSGTMRFLTLYSNGVIGGTQAPGIYCGTGNNTVEDSIIYSNLSGTTSPWTSNQTAGCMLTSTVVTNDPLATSATIKDTVDFVNIMGSDPAAYNLALKPDSVVNADCCIDKETRTGLIDHDINLVHRPKGNGSDIGAAEAR